MSGPFGPVTRASARGEPRSPRDPPHELFAPRVLYHHTNSDRRCLTRRAADSRRFAPLAADAAVRCASEEEHVSHPAPCLSKRVPCVLTIASTPPSQGSAHCTPLERLVSATARPEEPRITSSRATSSSPTWLGLGHASSVITRVSRCQSPPPTFASLLFSRARAPGFSKCPTSLLITSWARHRRHQFLRTPRGLSWLPHGVGHTLAPQQRPPAHLTRRAVDSHSFAVLATDAHG